MDIWLIDHYAVPPSYYPLARQTNFAKYLIRMGHSVKIFAASSVHNSDENLIKGKELYKELVVDGITYVIIKCKQYKGNGLQRILNMLEFAYKLPRVCAKYKVPDAIVSTSMTPFACAKGIKIAKKYGCKNIAQISDLWPETLVAYGVASPKNPAVLFLRRLEKWMYKSADRIVFTMEGAYDYIIEQGWEKVIPRKKVFCINNGVDLELYKYNCQNYIVEDKDLLDKSIIKVIYAGSVRGVNNLGLLLDVAKEMTDPRIVFLIWGTGDEKELLEKRVSDEGIKNVKFKGFVEKKFIPYITSCADLNFAHNMATPLFRFGISFNKIFDYLASGKPVISDFPCKYNPAIMMGAGVGVEEPTAKNVAQAIENFFKMEKSEYDQYCENARRAAIKYDFKQLTKELLNVIERAE